MNTFGRRLSMAFSVCQAISIAMTVVLPEPVAIFNAQRSSPGLASSLAFRRRSRMFLPVCPMCGATSVSQMIVSSASTWQKKGRSLSKLSDRQCSSSWRVVYVTPQSLGLGSLRHSSTCRRTSLMPEVVSYCCFSCASCSGFSMTKPDCAAALPTWRGGGTGVMKLESRRDSITVCVG